MTTTVPPPLVLCINLAGATLRWDSIQRQVPTALPGATLRRIEAVNWRNLPSDLPLTLFSRYLLRFPANQGLHRLSHRQMDTLSSVAILLSHVRCWEHIRANSTTPYALILEDDACFDAPFRETWTKDVVCMVLFCHEGTLNVPLLNDYTSWDCLTLGWSTHGGGEPSMSRFWDTLPLPTWNIQIGYCLGSRCGPPHSSSERMHTFSHARVRPCSCATPFPLTTRRTD